MPSATTPITHFQSTVYRIIRRSPRGLPLTGLLRAVFGASANRPKRNRLDEAVNLLASRGLVFDDGGRYRAAANVPLLTRALD